MNKMKLPVQPCKGFSLVECLVYCVVCSVFFILTFQWILKAHMVLKKQNTISNQIINECTAQDILLRELRQAPGQKKLWKKIAPQEIIWTNNAVDIGWSFEKNHLIRYEGSYSSKLEQWSQTTKSIVGSLKVFNIEITTIKKFNVDWVAHATITCNEHTIPVAIRNGIA